MSDLTAASSPSAQWAQLRDESSDEYAAFLQWLALVPRPAPSQCGPGVGELAGRRDWAARAQAYDAACKLMRAVPDLNPSGLMRNAAESWTLLTAIESAKLVDLALSSKAPTVEPRELQAFMRSFIELGQAYASQQEELDASDLTPEELTEWIRLHAKFKRK